MGQLRQAQTARPQLRALPLHEGEHLQGSVVHDPRQPLPLPKCHRTDPGPFLLGDGAFELGDEHPDADAHQEDRQHQVNPSDRHPRRDHQQWYRGGHGGGDPRGGSPQRSRIQAAASHPISRQGALPVGMLRDQRGREDQGTGHRTVSQMNPQAPVGGAPQQQRDGNRPHDDDHHGDDQPRLVPGGRVDEPGGDDNGVDRQHQADRGGDHEDPSQDVVVLAEPGGGCLGPSQGRGGGRCPRHQSPLAAGLGPPPGRGSTNSSDPFSLRSPYLTRVA